eukprot:1143200-Pelagomonas_calceolata.AAC.1
MALLQVHQRFYKPSLSRSITGININRPTNSTNLQHTLGTADSHHDKVLVTRIQGSQVLSVLLQIPTSPFCSLALWWRGIPALLSQCVSFPSIDAGRDPQPK